LLWNKLTKAGEVILCNSKAKNAGIAEATARLFNEVIARKNRPEWASYLVTNLKPTNFLVNRKELVLRAGFFFIFVL
jgi:hypothetical protein